MVPPLALARVYGWSPIGGRQGFATYEEGGSWTVPETGARTGTPVTEITADSFYPVEAGANYRVEVTVRFARSPAMVSLAAFTARGRRPLSSGVVRKEPEGTLVASAEYAAQAGDRWLRVPDLLVEGGGWREARLLRVSLCRVRAGAPPSFVRPKYAVLGLALAKLLWWPGISLVFLAGLAAGEGIGARRTFGERAASALVPGLAGLALVAAYQTISGGGRSLGFDVDPNLAAHGAAMAATLASTLVAPTLTPVVLIPGWLIVALTESRAAALALFITTVVSVYRMRGWRRAAWLAGFIGMVAAAVALSGGRFTLRAVQPDETALSRVSVARVALSAIGEHPLAGVGVDGFAEYFARHRSTLDLDPVVTHAHNLPLGLITESGILGAVAFGLLWAGPLTAAARGRNSRAWLLIAVAAVLNALDYTFFSSGVHYALLLGLGAALWGPEAARSAGRSCGVTV